MVGKAADTSTYRFSRGRNVSWLTGATAKTHFRSVPPSPQFDETSRHQNLPVCSGSE
jgi:hypothetical protein